MKIMYKISQRLLNKVDAENIRSGYNGDLHKFIDQLISDGILLVTTEGVLKPSEIGKKKLVG